MTVPRSALSWFAYLTFEPDVLNDMTKPLILPVSPKRFDQILEFEEADLDYLSYDNDYDGGKFLNLYFSYNYLKMIQSRNVFGSLFFLSLCILLAVVMVLSYIRRGRIME